MYLLKNIILTAIISFVSFPLAFLDDTTLKGKTAALKTVKSASQLRQLFYCKSYMGWHCTKL
jgi:hypothetical protein